jgi:PPP family 3-phenylpropionic acid transporter
MTLRLALFYAASFSIFGVQLPFWPVWLEARGMDPREIGLLLAVAPIVRIFAGPLIAPFADRLGRRKPIIVGAAICALATTALFAVAHGFWALALVAVVSGFFSTPMLPLVESLATIAARAGAVDYGRVRLWGSLAFIAAATLAGALVAERSADLVLALVLGALALTVAAAFALPDLRTPPAVNLRASMALLGNRSFLVAILAVTLLQASHQVYYGFSSLHWREVGLSEALIGALWAEGVVAEIVLFLVSTRIRLRPTTLLTIAAAGGILRWSILGTTDALPALIFAQALHAATFGATHLAAIRFIMATVPPEATTTAQSLYISVAGGIGAALYAAGAGALYADWGAGAYLAMALSSLAGGVVALVSARRPPRPPAPSPAFASGNRD